MLFLSPHPHPCSARCILVSGSYFFFCHVELVPSAGGNVMVGRVLICGEPIFGRGVAGVSGVGAGKYSPDPPCHADNRRLPTVCHKQTLPSLPWFRISTQIINFNFVVNIWKLQNIFDHFFIV